MPRFRKLSVFFISALLFLAAPLARGESPAQNASMPSQIEREYWEATRQIDSVAAYQAYLSKFPNGFYALLATAAISKAGSVAPSAVQQAKSRPTDAHLESPSSTVNAPFSAASIAGPAKSGAIAQKVGDVFHGPGPITVGWLGARKQVVVPRGEWVLLAAEDSQTPLVTRSLTASYTPPIPLTTLVLARLEGGVVRSFLLAQFNSREGNPKHSWSDAEDCKSPPSSAAFAWRDRGFLTTLCVVASLLPQKSLGKTLSGTIWEEALQKLADGGGKLPGSSYLVTNMFYTGDLSHYLHVSRVDFGVTSEEGSSSIAGASLDLSLQGREKWVKAYSELAAVGYRKNLSQKELLAGNPPTIAEDSLPD